MTWETGVWALPVDGRSPRRGTVGTRPEVLRDRTTTDVKPAEGGRLSYGGIGSRLDEKRRENLGNSGKIVEWKARRWEVRSSLLSVSVATCLLIFFDYHDGMS